jgi:protein involved in polysaccharide export with SLBB domain
LLPGDIITFFSTADLKVPTTQQTRFVRLEGEFVASGIYSVEPGETLRHLLQRAGGFTSEAYLYGSEFTRQSTKRVQQQRLNEFADSVEAQITAQASANNARSVSDLDAAANQAATAQANQTVARLRRIQPIGRIVLELKPDSRGIDAVPDLPLEDGDRFVVPRVPSTVAVEGQVYSANAFVFVRGRRERDYLRQAGGPDRNADRKRTFILRADGSVFSRQYGDVDKATMFPGDTIVVPPSFGRAAILRDLVDISNVVGGLGIGIAAINLLR